MKKIVLIIGLLSCSLLSMEKGKWTEAPLSDSIRLRDNFRMTGSYSPDSRLLLFFTFNPDGSGVYTTPICLQPILKNVGSDQLTDIHCYGIGSMKEKILSVLLACDKKLNDTACVLSLNLQQKVLHTTKIFSCADGGEFVKINIAFNEEDLLKITSLVRYKNHIKEIESNEQDQDAQKKGGILTKRYLLGK